MLPTWLLRYTKIPCSFRFYVIFIGITTVERVPLLFYWMWRSGPVGWYVSLTSTSFWPSDQPRALNFNFIRPVLRKSYVPLRVRKCVSPHAPQYRAGGRNAVNSEQNRPYTIQFLCGVEVPTAEKWSLLFFWVVKPRELVDRYWRFEGIYCLLLQVLRNILTYTDA